MKTAVFIPIDTKRPVEEVNLSVDGDETVFTKELKELISGTL